MASTPITATFGNTTENTSPPTITVTTLKMIITFIMASIFLLILVQYYPKYIIGLVLLIILSVLLYDWQQIANLLGSIRNKQ